jgi:hypothetical protein
MKTLLVYLSWLWPWKIVQWKYTEKGVIVNQGCGWWWRVAITASGVWALSLLINLTGVMQIRGEFLIFDMQAR